MSIRLESCFQRGGKMARNLLVICGGTGACLIGHQQALKLNAILQVDVKNELRKTDPNAPIFSQRLDPVITTTAQLLAWDRDRFPDDTPRGRHARYLAQHYPNSMPIVDGCGRSPAIGGSLIAHASVVSNLKTVLGTLLSGKGEETGTGDELVVWIFSSTAGGTGEGTHRYVARLIMQHMRPSKVPLKLYFVRVGPGTFNSVDPKRTRLNTFFAIAADVAFNFQAKEEDPWASLYWFYMDLPDVGTGKAGKDKRAQLVEMAAKGIMLPEVSEDLLTILAGGAQSVLVRTGYWTLDISDSNRKYSEALLALESKLRSLVETDVAIPQGDKELGDLTFEPGKFLGVFTSIDDDPKLASGILQLIKDRKFNITAYSGDIAEDKPEWDQAIETWRATVNGLLKLCDSDMRLDRESIGAYYTLPGSNDELVCLPRTYQEYDHNWFKAVTQAHRVKYWSNRLLQGLESRLRDHAKVIAGIENNKRLSDQEKANEIRPTLRPFIEELYQVRLLRQLRTRAKTDLQISLPRVRDTLADVRRQNQERAGSNGESNRLIEVTNLDSGEDKTWLYRLLNPSASSGGFRGEVLNGAVGLTHEGLKSVLGAPQKDYATLKDELRSKNGSLHAPWWQSQDIQAAQVYSYRVFPLLERGIADSLGAADGIITYRYATKGTIGLSVMALDIGVLDQSGDAIVTPEFLLRPLVGYVQEELLDWNDPPRGRISGKLHIALAGVVGDPLYWDLLPAVGLKSEEMNLLGEFYERY